MAKIVKFKENNTCLDSSAIVHTVVPSRDASSIKDILNKIYPKKEFSYDADEKYKKIFKLEGFSTYLVIIASIGGNSVEHAAAFLIVTGANDSTVGFIITIYNVHGYKAELNGLDLTINYLSQWHTTTITKLNIV